MPFWAPCCFSCRRRFLRMMEFHRFLMALAVRPGSILAMFDHLVPTSCTCDGGGASARVRLGKGCIVCEVLLVRWVCGVEAREVDGGGTHRPGRAT